MQTFSTVAGYRLLPTLHQFVAAGREQGPGSVMGTGSGTRRESRQGTPGTPWSTKGARPDLRHRTTRIKSPRHTLTGLC